MSQRSVKIALIAYGLAGCLVGSALAAPLPLACEPEGAGALELAGIAPDGTLTATDGTGFRLAGILWPDRLEPARRQALSTYISASLAGETLAYKPAGPPDRWGIRPAYLFVQEAGSGATPFWLQAGLVAAGLTPAWPELPTPCWQRLLAYESRARGDRRGFWAPRAQAARHSRMAQAASDQLGRRLVARWRVAAVRQGTWLTYVNFTPLFRVGPALALTSKQVQRLAEQGLPPETLVGRFVVVRLIAGPAGLKRARLAQAEGLMPDDGPN